MTKAPTPVEELTYEQAREELESIVASLETEKHSLDEAMALFERGLALTKRCTALLDQAELKIQQISGEEILPFNS
ncbi:MAG: exodeoxyribonuclease VII small subunit [Chloroflexi bacterium RBG_16_58_14]|nr:MAG: exodeoxyribonuclease VII small subunit [Chloroflexi bacterium RBG_16_58_14]